MGKEATGTAHFGNRKSTGKALLETSELLFRPNDGSPRVKIPFSAIKSAKAIDGHLRLQTADGPVSFDLGATAEKWCHKILHPKTRAEKLGVKAGVNISLLGKFDQEFLQELRAATKNVHYGEIAPATEIIFLMVASTKELSAEISKTAKTMKGATALWIAYPKANKEITENDVLTAGRKSGLKDVKVVGFSVTHTALKFVLPLDRR